MRPANRRAPRRAAVYQILRAASRAMRRDLGWFAAFEVNNFFLFVLLLVYSNVVFGLPPRSAYAPMLALGLLLLFPLSRDPLAKIPAVRRAIWPLGALSGAELRLASLAISPVFWIAALLFWRASPALALAFVGLVAAMQGGLAAVRHIPLETRGWIVSSIRVPGKLGPLAAAALRQMFSVFDTYLAILIALGGSIYRYASRAPDAAAYPVLSLLVALALSTYAQNLFGLDSDSAFTRYRLLPLTRYQILFAKDAAFIGVSLVLTLPLNPLVGAAFCLTSLALGRLARWRGAIRQRRWRFAGGRLGLGAAQVALGAALSLAAAKGNAAFALIPVAGLILSTSYWAAKRDQDGALPR